MNFDDHKASPKETIK